MMRDVSDTSLWIAAHRANESERANALFSDPLAGRLAGERGRMLVKRMRRGRFTAWTVVIRTWIIDRMIAELVGSGVDTFLNLGAGRGARHAALPPRPARGIALDRG
jgi:O-methyltransferase involved in polyketide biosynthesis